MQWRDDEQTLEETILIEKVAKSRDWEALGRLIVIRSRDGVTYEQVLQWPVSQVSEAAHALLAALPKRDGLDDFRHMME